MPEGVLRSSVCVVTGAASGIGAALARQARQAGFSLLLSDIDTLRLKALAEELEADYCVCDVGSFQDVDALAERATGYSQPIGAVFANAGMMQMGRLVDTPPELWSRLVNVNLLGCANMVRAFVPLLSKQESESHFVATASVAGLVSAPGSGAYNATKHGVVAICETLFHELKDEVPQVNVSVVCPGAVRTDFLNTEKYQHLAAEGKKAERLSKLMETAGISPEEVAECVFLSMKNKRFWIFPQNYILDRFEVRSQAVMTQSQPKWHPAKSK